MYAASPLPSAGEVFLDARGDERALRVSWHAEAETMVLSLWKDASCVGSFRLDVGDIPTLVDVLRAGLEQSYERHRGLLERAFGTDLAG